MSDQDFSYSSVMGNLSKVIDSIASEPSGDGGAPSESGEGKPSTADGEVRQFNKDVDEEVARMMEGKGDSPKPKTKPGARVSKPAEGEDDETPEEGEDDDGDDKKAAKPKDDKPKEKEGEDKAKRIRKLKRYGKEIELDLDDPETVDKILTMLSDENEIEVEINGATYKIPQGELPRGYQTGGAANDRFFQAKQLQDQVMQTIQTYRQSPAQLLRQIGVQPITDDQAIVDLLHAAGVEDPVQWAGKFAWNEVELLNLRNRDSATYDPDRYIELTRARDARMDALRQEQQQRQQQALAMQQQQQQQEQAMQQHLRAFAEALPDAMDRAGLPNTELTRQASYWLYQQAYNSGRVHAGMLSPDDLAQETRRWLEQNARDSYPVNDSKRFRETFGDEAIQAVLLAIAENPDALLDYVPKDVLKAIRAADTKRARRRQQTPAGSSYEPGEATSPSGLPTPGKQMTVTEANKWIRDLG